MSGAPSVPRRTGTGRCKARAPEKNAAEIKGKSAGSQGSAIEREAGRKESGFPGAYVRVPQNPVGCARFRESGFGCNLRYASSGNPFFVRAQYEFADLGVNPDRPEKSKKERFFTMGGSGLPGSLAPTAAPRSLCRAPRSVELRSEQNAVRNHDGCGTVGSWTLPEKRWKRHSAPIQKHGSIGSSTCPRKIETSPCTDPETWRHCSLQTDRSRAIGRAWR
jgi:hypothetical protein